MRVRGFVLSLDALVALGFASLALTMVVAASQSSSQAPQFARLGVLGRDYLVLKYSSGLDIAYSDFNSLCGLQVSELQPSDYFNWAAAEYYQYPRAFGCANASQCSFQASSASAAYGLVQDLSMDYKHSAWVQP
jgi:hypothetical protein